jgi:hypothetical protein
METQRKATANELRLFCRTNQMHTAYGIATADDAMIIQSVDKVMELVDQIKQERGQADQDAQRYKWLREQRGWPESEAAMMGISPEGFDETIDALMAEGK